MSHLLGARSQRDIVSYFFCRFDDEGSLSCTTIVGTLVRQLISDLPAQAFRAFRKTSSQTAMADFIRNTLSPEYQYFIILDGLDECEEGQVAEVVEFLYDLFASSALQFKVFLSTRPHVPTWLVKRFAPQQRVILDDKETRPQVASDMEAFISATLMDWLGGDEPELQIGDPTVVPEVCQRLISEAGGMYVDAHRDSHI